MAADLSEDVAELKSLLTQATRPHVHSLISTEIQTLEKVALSVLNQAKALPLKKGLSTPEIRYVTFSTFSWEQDVEKIKIYLSLEGASKDKVVTDFKSKSIELKVHDINGKNYRFSVPKLCKTINPEASTITVKTSRIILTLKKVDKGTWADLHLKEDKLKPKLDDKEPSSGLMQLMKNMYDEGDDEMKKNIAKAYTEARAGKTPGMTKF